MVNKLVHFSDLHIRLFKDHDLYRDIVTDMLSKFSEIKPDRIVFTGDLVHSKNQMTPELIEMVSWILKECSYIAKTIIIPGNHDFLVNNIDRLDALSPIIDSLNNNNIVYYKDRGVYEDGNVSWCVYSQYQGNIPPDISEAKGIKVGLFLLSHFQLIRLILTLFHLTLPQTSLSSRSSVLQTPLAKVFAFFFLVLSY